MSEIDPFKDPPLYESTQVLTFYDLTGIRNGYYYQYQQLPWFKFAVRFKFLVGIGVCNQMLHWLAHGKPATGIHCEAEHKT